MFRIGLHAAKQQFSKGNCIFNQTDRNPVSVLCGGDGRSPQPRTDS